MRRPPSCRTIVPLSPTSAPLWRHPRGAQCKGPFSRWTECKRCRDKPNTPITEGNKPEKTHITHWDRRFRFLGGDLRGQRNPHGTRWLRLTIPPEKERGLKAKVKRLCRDTQISELDLFISVNALMRGWTQYFRYVHNAPRRFRYLTGLAYGLIAHYLGRKHRRSITQIMRIAYGVDPASHKRAVYTSQGGKRVYLWNKPPQRGSLFSIGRGGRMSNPSTHQLGNGPQL